MAIWDSKKLDVLPFMAMAVVDCTSVGLVTLYKAATLKGLNFFVYITYSYTFGTLILLPLSFIFSRRGLIPSSTSSVLYRLILLAAFSFLARISGFKGIEYSSPALSSAIGTLTPAFTFLLAVIFRMENVDLRSSSARAKIIGTMVSVSGALVVVLYKGPTILSSPSATVPSHLSLHHSPVLQTSKINWVIGGLLLTLDKLLNAICLILQTQILKLYPAQLIVSFAKCLFVTIIAIPVSFMVERELSAWTLKPDITLICVVYSVFFGPAFIVSIHNFCLPLKGPLYIAIFMPFSIVLATAVSVVFLGDALHLGSVVGAAILLLGFYTVLWGKAKEEKGKDHCGFVNLEASPYDENTPLLQSQRDGKFVE